MRVTVIPTAVGIFGTILKGFVKSTEILIYKRTSRDHYDNSLIQIGQNTEKSPED